MILDGFRVQLDFRSHRAQTLPHKTVQRNLPTPVQENLYDTQCISSQAIRVFRAAGNQAHPDTAQNSIELVRDRNNRPQLTHGRIISRKGRAVMFLDRLSNHGFLPRMGSVISAHDPLQFRKFINHQGYQIGLAQTPGSQCLRFLIRTYMSGQNPDQAANPFHFFIQGSQLFLEYNSFQWLHKIIQIFLLVLIIEKSGVLQSCTQNSLVAIFDFMPLSGRHIANRNKAGQ